MAKITGMNVKEYFNEKKNYFNRDENARKNLEFARPKVYLCIGSDKLVFDCLGPIVGSLLKKDARFNGYVYGTVEEPVTALQVEEAVRFIRRFHFGAEITVVDSAVGRREEVGKIKRFDQGLRPALGVDKKMTVVGDKSVMGVITTKDRVRDMRSCNVKLHDVYSMAKAVADMICEEISPIACAEK
ncbi:MAG: spore protease YyaC [Clostridia bacterium]|nr:spore protease YyaC [Clostridia bacterium]